MTTRNRNVFVAVGFVGLMITAIPTFAQPQFAPLTVDEIEEAIDLGTEREPEPYVMRYNTVGASEEHARHGFGLVFTPFLRVQFLSHATWWRTGVRLTPGQIPPAVLAPVIHIATWLQRWPELPCQQQHPPRFGVFGPGSLYVVQDWTLCVLPTKWARRVSPRWEKRGLDALERYGVAWTLRQRGSSAAAKAWAVPLNDEWLVVAYPLEFLRTDLNYAITWGDGGFGSCHRSGHIRERDLATWR